MNLLKGKVAIITGGSRGIGRAIAIRFAEEGARVVINYAENNEAAKDVVSGALNKGLEILSIKGSVASANDVKNLIEETKKSYGRIDILVNNAGIKRDGFLMMMKERDWDEIINVNLKGTYLCCREVIKTMISQRGGRIINITSLTGVVGQAGQTNYAASKGGIISFTKALAKEVAHFGILVNAMAPGFIETDMLRDVPEEILKESIRVIPLQRFGKPEEIADVALFLASEMSNYITGQVLHVNGGQIM
jgi:3-oxoacyl-[acyl-carrier protein] reductase